MTNTPLLLPSLRSMLILGFIVFLNSCAYILIEKRTYLKRGYYVHCVPKRTSTPKRYSRTSAWSDTTAVAVEDTATDIVPPVDSSWTETCVNAHQDSSCVIWGFRLLPMVRSDTTILRYESFSYTEPGEVHNDTIYEEHHVVIDNSVPQKKAAARTSPPRSASRSYSYKTPERRAQAFWMQGGLYVLQVPAGSPAMPYSYSIGCGYRINSRPKGSCTANADLGFRFQEFYMKQDDEKPFFLTREQHARERIAAHELYGALFLRWRLPKRPLEREKSLGVGVFGCWSFRNADVYVDRYVDHESGLHYNMKTKITHLQYMQDWNYGLSVRYSQNYFSISASYRISQLIETEAWNRDVPRMLITMEYLPHRKKKKDD
jgi:hypothetical protein